MKELASPTYTAPPSTCTLLPVPITKSVNEELYIPRVANALLFNEIAPPLTVFGAVIRFSVTLFKNTFAKIPVDVRITALEAFEVTLFISLLITLALTSVPLIDTRETPFNTIFKTDVWSIIKTPNVTLRNV
jgi:hypothetical protein